MACRIIKDSNDVISMLSDIDSDVSDEFPFPEVDSGDER